MTKYRIEVTWEANRQLWRWHVTYYNKRLGVWLTLFSGRSSWRWRAHKKARRALTDYLIYEKEAAEKSRGNVREEFTA